jgi:hypothetical protein
MSRSNVWRVARWAVVLAIVAEAVIAIGARAQWLPGTWALYGHETRRSNTITIDTVTARTAPVGPVGFPALSSGMTTALGAVMTSHGVVYPAGTAFGLFRDQNFSKDYVTTLNPFTGQQNKVVELDLSVSGRGVAFGPDGRTLYVLIPPGELYTVSPLNGAVKLVGKVLDSAGAQYPGTSLALDAATGDFLAFAGRMQNTLIRINPTTAHAQVIGPLPEFTSCSLAVAPAAVPGPGGTTLPAGMFFTLNRATNELLALQVDVANLKILQTVHIGKIGPGRDNSAAMESVCAIAFGLRSVPTPQVTPWTPTPFPTGTATPPGTPPAPPAKTPTPDTANCVCPLLWKTVPSVIIYDALANPGRYYGWQMPLNPNKPAGPDNPPRQCLRLRNPGAPYHSLWNAPIWYVGCQ